MAILFLPFTISRIISKTTTYSFTSQTARSYAFMYIPLQSGFWSSKSVAELALEKEKAEVYYEESARDFNILHSKYLELKQAEDLDMKLSDVSKNRGMNDIIESNRSFFNKESSNNREEGIKELKKDIEQKNFFLINVQILKRLLMK